MTMTNDKAVGVKFLATRVNGLPHHVGNLPGGYLARLEAAASSDANVKLDPVREPDNEYDKMAIRLDHAGHKLGYIPAPQAAWLAPLMDAGLMLGVTIRRFDRVPGANPGTLPVILIDLAMPVVPGLCAPRDPQDVAPAHPALVAFHKRVREIELPGEAVAVWRRHRADLAALPSADRETAWKALCAKTEDVGRMKNAKVWLKKAIAEEDARHAP